MREPGGKAHFKSLQGFPPLFLLSQISLSNGLMYGNAQRGPRAFPCTSHQPCESISRQTATAVSPGQVAEQQSSPWDHRLRLDVPLPGVCFINCICSALFFFFFFYFKMKSLQGCWNFCANTGLRYPATTENGNKTQYKSIPLDYYWDMIVNIQSLKLQVNYNKDLFKNGQLILPKSKYFIQ